MKARYEGAPGMRPGSQRTQRIPKRVSRRKSPCSIPYMTGVSNVIERRESLIVCNARV
jgi:hypothetical protein